MIDLHCHLLPGIDDGPPDVAGAVALARAQVEAGVRYVAATPHIDWEHGVRGPRMREELAALRPALADAGVPLAIGAGGEVALTLAAELDDAELDDVKLGGGPWLLLETPLSPGAIGFDRIVQEVQMRGHRVLLAHPERAPIVQKDPEVLERLVQGGALVQLTAGSFAGMFGGHVQRCALDLVGRGLVHVVASDAHSATRRPPGLRPALQDAGLGAFADWMCDAVPAALLAGSPLPAAPGPFPQPRRRRSLLRRDR